MDDAGVQLLGNYTLNGQPVTSQTEVDEDETEKSTTSSIKNLILLSVFEVI